MEGQDTSAYIASQYVTLYAQPSDQLVGDVAYVRLVAVVTPIHWPVLNSTWKGAPPMISPYAYLLPCLVGLG